MLKITFKKYHIKKKKPVTRAGNLSAKLFEGFACPSEISVSRPSASASAAAAEATGNSTWHRRLMF